MYGSNLIVIAKNEKIRCQKIRQSSLTIFILFLSVFTTACAFSENEEPPLYPRTDLPIGSLVFTVNKQNLFKMDNNKSLDQSITELYIDLGHSPALSPDGSRTVFIWSQRLLREPLDPSASLYYPPGLYLLNLTENQSPKLLWRDHDRPRETGDPSPFSPRWSPNGEKIVFLLAACRKSPCWRSDDQQKYTLLTQTRLMMADT